MDGRALGVTAAGGLAIVTEIEGGYWAGLAPHDKRATKFFLISEPGVWGLGNGYLRDIPFCARLLDQTTVGRPVGRPSRKSSSWAGHAMIVRNASGSLYSLRQRIMKPIGTR